MRENCTSGSVRGALGNRRSYREMPFFEEMNLQERTFWLPSNKISEGNIEKLIDLIKTNIQNYRVIEQPAPLGFGPKSGPHS